MQAVTTLLNQVSKVLSDLCKQTIALVPTGNQCLNENGKVSIEIHEVNIPDSIISEPNPSCPQNPDGIYKVNRIRLGKGILDDMAKGCPFSDDEIKDVIKGIDTWVYYASNK